MAAARNRSRVLVGALALTSALIGSACSSEERDTLRQLEAQGDRFVEQVGDDFDTDQQLSGDEIACLDDSEVSPSSLFGGTMGRAETERLIGLFFECIDDPASFDPLVAGIVGSLELSIGNGLDIAADEGRCLLRRIMATAPDPARALGNPSPQDVDRFVDAAQECLSADAFAALTGQSGFTSYGDDPQLDALYDECDGGDDRACDLLYFRSAIGSEYEDLALDCAGRVPASDTSCSVDAELDPATGYLDPDGDGAAALVADCEAGDLLACDLLYSLAPVGSDVEQIGTTCGGRLNVPAVPDCRTVLDP